MHIRARNVLFVSILVLCVLSVAPVAIGHESTVGSSTSSDATKFLGHSKIFNASSLYWVWYSDGTNLIFSSSSDRSTWSSPTVVSACTNGGIFSVAYNGSRFAYALDTDSGLKFRQGAPYSNGTIIWDAVEQTVLIGTSGFPVIEFDSIGKPVIGYYAYYGWVVKSSKLDGTWTNASGFPYELQSDDINEPFGIARLTNEKFLVLYWKYLAELGAFSIRAKLWNGTAFGSIENSGAYFGAGASFVAVGDDVHVVLSASGFLMHIKRSSAGVWTTDLWSEPNIDVFSTPSISKEDSTLYVTWIDKSKNLYIRKYVSTWSTDAYWFTASTSYVANSLNVIQEKSGSTFALIYTSGSYIVNFVEANFSMTVAGLTITNTSNGFPILNATYDIDVRTLQFYTLGNVTVTGITTNPQRVSVSDVFVGFDFSVPTLTLNDVTGQVRIYWKLEEKTSGQNPQAPTQTNIPPVLTTPVFGQLGTLGLYIIVFAVSIITVGGIVAGVSGHKRAPKPRGQSRSGRSPTGFSRRSRR